MANAPWLYPGSWHDAMAQGARRQFGIGALFSTPLVMGGVVYVGSADGYPYALHSPRKARASTAVPALALVRAAAAVNLNTVVASGGRVVKRQSSGYRPVRAQCK